MGAVLQLGATQVFGNVLCEFVDSSMHIYRFLG